MYDSTCNLYFKDEHGLVSYKCYEKKRKTGFYINGDSHEGLSSIFKKMNEKKFHANLN